jgi:hypothetical protein
MYREIGFLILMLLIGSFPRPARGLDREDVRPWWIMTELGEGQLQLKSDQVTGKSKATFAFGVAGGHSLGKQVRIGLAANGWLRQAYNLDNPMVGESVSNATVVVDAFPIRKVPFFLRGGTGGAFYQDNRPSGSRGSGWCWTAGAGYEIRFMQGFGLAPTVVYSAGNLGDVQNIGTVRTGRRYSALEFKLGILWHIGRPKQGSPPGGPARVMGPMPAGRPSVGVSRGL